MYKFVDTSRVLLRNLVKSSDDFFDPLVDSPLQIKHLHEPLGPHEEKYIERLMAGKLTKEERRIIGFRDDLVDVVLERTVNECKGTYLTAKLAQQFGLASNIAGGTHHASRVGGSGFTIVNDLAIASFMLLNEGVGKILVVDCDVHAGDGTASIAKNVDGFVTFDVNCGANFPFDQEVRADYDVILPRGAGDEEYLLALNTELTRCLDAEKPDFVFYDAGVDVLADDDLGHLELSTAGLRKRDFFVIQSCIDRQVPVACVVGGGYRTVNKRRMSISTIQRKKNALAEAHAVIHEEAARAWRANRMWIGSRSS